MRDIMTSIVTESEYRSLEHIFYEPAKSFAKDNGALMSIYKNDPEDDCLNFYLNIQGIDYSISVQRSHDGGTLLYVKEKKQALADLGIDLKSIE